MVKKENKGKLKGFYKGYDIKWLKENPDHPMFKLVAEFEKKNK
jgi:hypothetical protein